MNSSREIILASTSPRRQELLKTLGLNFYVAGSRYPEDMTLDLKPIDLVKYLARGKAKAVAENYHKEVVIGADTIVVLGKKIMGKPKNEANAAAMLKALSGRVHQVITGYCIVDSVTSASVTKAVTTKVHFKKLSGDEIKNYVNSGEPLDKAGAYAVQGLGALLIKKIDGDYSNVVGLPLQSLAEDLKKFGVTIV